MVGLFLAILELAKQRRIVPEQGEPFTDIWVSLAPDGAHAAADLRQEAEKDSRPIAASPG